jgi:hypothetical protein
VVDAHSDASAARTVTSEAAVASTSDEEMTRTILGIAS